LLGNRSLPLDKQDSLKIAMFDRGPGTAWLQQSGLLEQGVPYQTMTGDDENNTAMMIEKEDRGQTWLFLNYLACLKVKI
jgi:hypothetical protein